MSQTENANDRFERLAHEFYRETDMLAPGKDDCLGHHSYEDRRAAWDAWLADRAPERSAPTMDGLTRYRPTRLDPLGMTASATGEWLAFSDVADRFAALGEENTALREELRSIDATLGNAGAFDRYTNRVDKIACMLRTLASENVPPVHLDVAPLSPREPAA